VTPYNPNGLLAYLDPSAVNKILAYCPNPELKWADATSQPFIGTDVEFALLPEDPTPCVLCNVITTRKEDYLNLGRGATHGFEIGASVEDTSLCPGVVRKLTLNGDLGVGQKICTTCSKKFAERGIINLEQCPEANDDDGLCFICPGWFSWESNEVSDIRVVAEYLLFWQVLVTGHFAYLIYTNGIFPEESKIKYFRRKLQKYFQ